MQVARRRGIIATMADSSSESQIEILQFEAPHSLLHEFIALSKTIYREDPYWVQPLTIDLKTLLTPHKHPYHRHAWSTLLLATRDGKPAGRMAVHINHRYNERWKESVGHFGFFECENRAETARALLDHAETLLKQQGCDTVRGPFSWSTNEEVGLLVEGFDSAPTIMMPHNPPYYAQLIEACGYKKAKDLYAYWMEDAGGIPERLQRGVEVVRKRKNVAVRPIDMKHFDRDVQLAKEVYNEAWFENWSAVPMTDEEFAHLAKDLKTVIDPELVIFAFVNDELAGFSLSVPDANQAITQAKGRLFPFGIVKMLLELKKITHFRTLALGVVEKFRGLGIDTVIYYESYKRGRERGYKSAELSWILEDNYAMRNPLEKLGGRIYKTYRVYEKPL